jgi:HAD superfamily hydrolase (TIGR01509 family)
MDGVILDSREFAYRAIEDVLAINKVKNVTREEIAAVTGKPIYAMYEVFAPHLDAYQLEREHLAHHELNMHMLKAYDGAHKVLGELVLSKRVGLFTGFDHQTYGRLEQFGLKGYFKSIVECTRYTEHKPHPEGLFMCMNELGAIPEQTVYIGDGVSDMIAGRSAGVRAVVGITHGFSSKSALVTAGADHIIDSLYDVPGLIAELEQK